MKKQFWRDLSNSAKATEKGSAEVLFSPSQSCHCAIPISVCNGEFLSELRKHICLLNQSPHGSQSDQVKAGSDHFSP